MKKRKMDLQLVLPSAGAECDDCVARLRDAVRAMPGVADAHIDTSQANAKLCLHYAPASVRLEELKVATLLHRVRH